MKIKTIRSLNLNLDSKWGVSTAMCSFTIKGQDLINDWTMRFWMGGN
jgi:hypothetical protein